MLTKFRTQVKANRSAVEGRLVTSRACTHAGMDPVDFVLTDFSPTKKQAVEDAVAKVGEAVPFMLKEGLAAGEQFLLRPTFGQTEHVSRMDSRVE